MSNGVKCNYAVVGLQWGDEGKGKFVDILARKCACVARFCGGANAGHTVVVGGSKYKLHLLPCGLLHDGVLNVIGNGVAFDPEVCVQELSMLNERGVDLSPRQLMISAACAMVMPWHKLFDRMSEASLGGGKIGTTARGIGPAYSDKAARSQAFRVADLLLPDDELRDKVERIVAAKRKAFLALRCGEEAAEDARELSVQHVHAACTLYRERIGKFIGNTGAVLRSFCSAGKPILFEGGQGTMLDVDHGTFPFVTSSSVTTAGIPVGTGVSVKSVGHVFGILKAYCTRVGAGPFPTEQDNDIGDRLRVRGHEFGTTTGRPRRCGWLDLFQAKYSCELSGVDQIVLSLLDVLSGFERIYVCTGYEGVETYDAACLASAVPVWRVLDGWTEDIAGAQKFADLPERARDYVSLVEDYVGCPVSHIGVGPDRAQLISRDN